jgi:hypothetical protein
MAPVNALFVIVETVAVAFRATTIESARLAASATAI